MATEKSSTCKIISQELSFLSVSISGCIFNVYAIAIEQRINNIQQHILQHIAISRRITNLRNI